MGGGRESRIDALARASGRAATATRGRLFCFGNERAKPLVFPPNQATEPAGSLAHQRRNRQVPAAASRHKNGALARRDADGRPAAASKSLPVVARQRSPGEGMQCRPTAGVRQGERQERQRVSTKAPRPQERSGKERDPKSSRSTFGRPCFLYAMRSSPKAETRYAARWSEPAQTGSRNRARCGLARRRRSTLISY